MVVFINDLNSVESFHVYLIIKLFFAHLECILKSKQLKITGESKIVKKI